MSGTEVYQYDSLGNLVVAWYPDGRKAEFTYDAADNRTQTQVTQTSPPPGPAATAASPPDTPGAK